jgi:hypothetical protein
MSSSLASYAIRWIDNALKEASLALNQPHFLRRFSNILSAKPLYAAQYAE